MWSKRRRKELAKQQQQPPAAANAPVVRGAKTTAPNASASPTAPPPPPRPLLDKKQHSLMELFKALTAEVDKGNSVMNRQHALALATQLKAESKRMLVSATDEGKRKQATEFLTSVDSIMLSLKVGMLICMYWPREEQDVLQQHTKKPKPVAGTVAVTAAAPPPPPPPMAGSSNRIALPVLTASNGKAGAACTRAPAHYFAASFNQHPMHNK
jgi:hypothetical protein